MMSMTEHFEQLRLVIFSSGLICVCNLKFDEIMSRLVKENGENEGFGVEEVVSREINFFPRRPFSFHPQTSPPRHLLINQHHSRQQLSIAQIWAKVILVH
jgi:hypothetical protein